jgi:hypothetical protein
MGSNVVTIQYETPGIRRSKSRWEILARSGLDFICPKHVNDEEFL